MPTTSQPFRNKRLCISIVAAALWTAGFVVWPGCATPPLPSRRTPAGNVQRADVTMVKRSQSTKNEVMARLGKPDEDFADLRVACYHLNHLSRRRLLLFLGIVPMGTDTDNLGLEVVMFQFDAQGKIRRHARRTVRFPYSWFGMTVARSVTSPDAVPAGYFSKLLRTAAEEWVNGLSGKP